MSGSMSLSMLRFTCLALILHTSFAFRISKKKGNSGVAVGVDVRVADGPTSEALRAATKELDGHILAQETAIADSKLNVQRAQQNKAAKEREYAVKDKWYKIQHWSIWSDTLQNLRNEIQRFDSQATSLQHLLAEQKRELGRLEAARAHKIKGTELALEYEGLVSSLSEQLKQKQNENEQTLGVHKTARQTAMKEADEKIRIHNADIAKLRTAEANAREEYDKLKSGTHDLHKNMEVAKLAIQKTITEHEQTITGLTASIALHDEKETNTQQAQKRTEEDYDSAISKLSAARQTMQKALDAAKEDKAKAEKLLASVSLEREGEINKLMESLAASIEGLQRERNEAETVRANQLIANVKELETLQLHHSQTLDSFEADISNLQSEINEARSSIQELRSEHFGDDDDSTKGPVADALHKAHADLETQVLQQQKALAYTETELRTATHDKMAKEKELESEDRWWKFWNWKIWSKKVDNIRAAIAHFGSEINRLAALRGTQEASINRLHAARDAKFDAAKLAREYEGLVTSLSAQLETKKQTRDETAKFQDDEIKAATSEGEEKVGIYTSVIEELVASLETAQAEHTELTDGTHDKHQALAQAREAIEKAIKQHDNVIKNMEASMSLNEQTINQKTSDKQAIAEEFSHVLNELAAQKAKMLAAKESAEADKQGTEKKLAAAVANNANKMDALEKTLSQSIGSLNSRIKQTDEIRAKQIVANGEYMKSMKQSHDEVYQKAVSEIEGLERQLQQAQATVDKLHAEHLG